MSQVIYASIPMMLQNFSSTRWIAAVLSEQTRATPTRSMLKTTTCSNCSSSNWLSRQSSLMTQRKTMIIKQMSRWSNLSKSLWTKMTRESIDLQRTSTNQIRQNRSLISLTTTAYRTPHIWDHKSSCHSFRNQSRIHMQLRSLSSIASCKKS